MGTSSRSAEIGEGDTIHRGTTLAFVAKVGGGAFSAGITIFLARRLGVHSYGVFALALSIVLLVQLVSDCGISVAMPRFVAEHRADRLRVRQLVADGLLLETVTSVLFGAALAALAGVIADAYHTPGLALPLRALAIALVGTKLLVFCTGVFGALRRQSLVLWSFVIESVAELSASVALVLIVGGAAGAAFGRAAGFAVGAFAGVVLASRIVGGGLRPNPLSAERDMSRMVRYSGALWIIDGIYTAFTQIDSLLIGGFLAAGSVAFFQAPMRLTVVLQYPGSAIAAVVAPRLVRSRHARPDVDAFAGAARILIILMMCVTVFTTVWAGPIIHDTLGDGYGRAADVLRFLAPFVFLCGLAELVSVSLNFLGRARARIPIALATLLLNFGLDLILIPKLGVVGGAIGSDVGLAVYVLGHLRLCVSTMHLSVKPFLVTLTRCAIAAVPMTLCLALVGTGERLPVVAIVLGGLAAVIIYVAGLVLTGETSPREIRDRLPRASHGARKSEVQGASLSSAGGRGAHMSSGPEQVVSEQVLAERS